MVRSTARAASRRAREQAERIGSEVKLARAAAGLSRKAAAVRAGVSPDTERRVEQGDPGVQLDTLCAIGEAVGVDVVVRGYPSRGSALRDAGQLSLTERLCRLANPGWSPVLEVPAGAHGEAMDVGFFGPTEIVACEIERLLLDGQAQYRRAATKRDELGRRHQRPVRLVVVVEDTRRNRAAVAEHANVFARFLPAGSREILVALRTGRQLGRDGLLWLRRSPG